MISFNKIFSNVIQISPLLKQASTYTLTIVVISSGALLFLSGASLLIGDFIGGQHPLILGAMVIFLTLLITPLHSYIYSKLDEVIFHSQGYFQARLRSFNLETIEILEVSKICNHLRQYITHDLNPHRLHIFIFDPTTENYHAIPVESNYPTTDILFGMDSPLVVLLKTMKSKTFKLTGNTLPGNLKTERVRLVILNSKYYLPLKNQNIIEGWVAFSDKSEGKPYTERDLHYLEDLGSQVSSGIQRAKVVSDLERRVREMDVLVRMAKGINITLTLDDILELIYAQTIHVIPAIDFYISLYKKEEDALYHVFYLENDERYHEKENISLLKGYGLEREVILSRKPIFTNNYVLECRSRGTIPAQKGLYAWLGVPLTSGAEIIGVLSLGNRNPNLLFTEQNQALLQTIADQAAGAIVKSRLLQETESRARQLASLNEIGRHLTATLELHSLYKLILQYSAEVFRCKAGAIFTIDETKNELLLEVMHGFLDQNLCGHLIPTNTGFVGRALISGKGFFVNNVQTVEEINYPGSNDNPAATRDLLIVPMKIQEKVVGLIEVLDKEDGSPFNADDLELLSAFSNQAATTIENARLYTHTDQALTDRIEELSVMQQIDRELNASLELSRVMNITLDWAIRQSHAEAGFIGMIEESGIRIITAQGYPKESIPMDSQGDEQPYLLEMPTLIQGIHSGTPKRVVLSQSSYSGENDRENCLHNPQLLLPGGQIQLIVPIEREAHILALLLLESVKTDFCPDETVAFLSRLCDHAAIAISNAQLYEEVQQANLAKSEFVSLVSHELKTPMTSIRGFSDLLVQGSIGPINEAQANFLNTIRSNVNRMATLVTDLADVSRIESGRLHLEFRAVAISEVVEEVIVSLRNQILEKEQTLLLKIPEELPNVWGDRNRLIQILVNLINNANKYTPKKGEITVSAESLIEQNEGKGAIEVVRVAVIDTGFGIAIEDQEKIFQKFFRSKNANVRESPGTGLGLNITRYLVEMQGGRIWFESELGIGTTFHFTIPIAANI